MAPSGFDMFLISITHYVFHFFKLSGMEFNSQYCNNVNKLMVGVMLYIILITIGVSVNLSIGVVVTVGILLLVALLVTW